MRKTCKYDAPRLPLEFVCEKRLGAQVACSKQWNNPRPNVEISSVDVVYGKDRHGIPALLALSSATAQ